LRARKVEALVLVGVAHVEDRHALRLGDHQFVDADLRYFYEVTLPGPTEVAGRVGVAVRRRRVVEQRDVDVLRGTVERTFAGGEGRLQRGEAPRARPH